jgi:uncharacterized membrane protein YkoI
MVIRRAMFVAALAFPLAAGSALAQAQAPSREEERQEQRIDLSRVPAAATNAARQALNAPITEAYEAGQQNGQAVYELEGRDQQGREVGVHVTASGQIVKRESERD